VKIGGGEGGPGEEKEKGNCDREKKKRLLAKRFNFSEPKKV